MKKIVALFLVLTLVLGLCACGATAEGGTTAAITEAPAAATLKVGYGKIDITPTDSVPLSGYGNSSQRMSTGILDYLYATCIYAEDAQGNAVLIMAMDLSNMYDPLPVYREKVAKKVGLPLENVMFCCSHTHSAPDLRLGQVSSQSKYNNELLSKLEKVAQEAFADATAVTGMFTSSIETESLNFIRRYVMLDGSYAGDNYGDHSIGYAGHESDPDTTLQLLKFTRESGKDVILTNFQTHPHLTGGAKLYDVSSDTVGVYRAEIESRLDCNALYFSGSSGNVNPDSRIKEENVYKDHRSHGRKMADYAVEAAGSFTELELGDVRVAGTVYTGSVNHSEDDLVTYAQEIEARKDQGMTNSEAMDGYKQYGITSVYHASSIISKSKLPATMNVELFGLSIGNFGMVFAPFELYSELGEMIKDSSDFGATFVCCYANQLYSYMPTQLGFDHGGYGPGQCKFVPGTGEELVKEYQQILNTLYTAQ